MIYLLYGTQNYLINKKINELTKDKEDYEIEKLDLENTSIKNIIDSASTYSLFSNNKTLIIYNSYIFSATKKVEENDLKLLEQYIENPNKDTTLIFIVDKIDSRKKIVTSFKKHCNVLEFDEVTNINKLVEEMFRPYKISNSQINSLINRAGNDLYNLENEINKLKTYKNDDFTITDTDIENLTIKNINTDIFCLIDNIINKNKDAALESYYEMLKMGEEPIKIIVILANQFRLMYQVKELSKKGYRVFDIMDILEQKQYPIKKAIEKGYKYDSNILLEYLYKLSDLDINIKSGLVDKNIGLELFILDI